MAEFGVVSLGQPAHASSGELKDTIGLLEDSESVAERVMGSIADAVPGATASESQGIIRLLERYESDFPPFCSSGCLSVLHVQVCLPCLVFLLVFAPFLHFLLCLLLLHMRA